METRFGLIKGLVIPAALAYLNMESVEARYEHAVVAANCEAYSQQPFLSLLRGGRHLQSGEPEGCLVAGNP